MRAERVLIANNVYHTFSNMRRLFSWEGSYKKKVVFCSLAFYIKPLVEGQVNHMQL